MINLNLIENVPTSNDELKALCDANLLSYNKKISQLLADSLGITNKINLLNKIKLKLWGVRIEIHKTNDQNQEIIKIYKRKKLISTTKLNIIYL